MVAYISPQFRLVTTTSELKKVLLTHQTCPIRGIRLSGIGECEGLKGLGGVKRISRLVRRPTRLFGYFLSSASLGNRHALGMSSG